MVHSVLVVDSHPIYVIGLKSFIDSESGFFCCGEALDETGVLKNLTVLRPDLIVIDITLCMGDEFRLLKDIKLIDDKVKILVTSACPENWRIDLLIQAGANGFIGKWESSRSMVEAIRSVLGAGYYLGDAFNSAFARMRLRGTKQLDIPEERLSSREKDVFGLLGKGYSTRRIAEKLNVSTKTVDTHKWHIKHKLGLSDHTVLIQKAVEWAIRESIA